MTDNMSRAGGAPIVAVDAMGGDKGPAVVAEGVMAALKLREYRFLVAGDEATLRAEFKRLRAENHPAITIMSATDVITMNDHPVEAIRRKKNSSLVLAARAVREGRAQALVSPANTGAVLAAGSLILGRTNEVERPGIAGLIPHKKGGLTVLIDVGANSDCRPAHLLHFAIMGAVYASAILGTPEPRIGLLSIGEEREKGNALTHETLPLLEDFFGRGDLPLKARFLGNVEGRDIANGKADVVVCDGFVGNALLKCSESLAMGLLSLLRAELTANLVRRLATAVLRSAFIDFKKKIDYSEYGGAPLLGVRHPCIICHGSSNAKAIKNAVRVAGEALDHDLCGRIEKMVAACAGLAIKTTAASA